MGKQNESEKENIIVAIKINKSQYQNPVYCLSFETLKSHIRLLINLKKVTMNKIMIEELIFSAIKLTFIKR